MWRRITDPIYDYLKSNGIEPLYIMNILLLAYLFYTGRKKIKNWDTISDDDKKILKWQIIGLGVVTCGSVLNFFKLL